VRNLLAIDLLSVGAPMLLMGDEVRRTQAGNNNAYGHDDAISWFDWTAVEREAGLRRFTAGLIQLRRRVATLLDLPDDLGLLDLLEGARVEWNGVRVGEPDLGDDSHSLSLTLRADAGALQVIFNAYWEPLAFDLAAPDVDVLGWRRVVDTSLASPDDIAFDWDSATEVAGTNYVAAARSVVVLAARRSPGASSLRRTK
jgi:glycogen operon protein